ncbi:SURF1 family protein [Halomonas sp. TRM85114]|uniref:SURF1 family protein n=1 Tax=Halomonas jincaotanensis TaxID=2810616 RepID=UPI001BD4BA9F|nr:SURF1 family protein [Halomonas jincaotanensis]MBS9405571.1 SURF1 family protein [Halomonas jincaotanensis]
MKNSVTGADGKQARARHRRIWLWWSLWTLIVLLGLCLGLWQWERAEDKRNFLTALEAAPLIQEPSSTPPEGATLTLSGEYQANHTLFLDNRTLEGRLGVAVLTPLLDEQGQHWLVQRGFMATDMGRGTPEVATPAGKVTLRGQWQAKNEGAPLFGPNQEGLRLQRITLDAWDQEFDFSGWLHLEEGPGMLDAWWTPNVMPPSRHLGYAFQWWSLTLAAFIAMLIGGLRLTRDASRQPLPKPDE